MARDRTQGRVRRQIQDLFIGNAGGIADLLGAEQVEARFWIRACSFATVSSRP